MRCTVRIPLSKDGRCETYCYEPLNDKGECPKHGPQWMPIPHQDAKGDTTTLSDMSGSSRTK